MKKQVGLHVDLEFQDGILIARYKPGPKIDLAAAREILQQRLEFTSYESVPVLVIDSGMVSMDKAARDYLSSDAGVQGIKASAIISTSVVNSMLVNFVLRISRPNLPVRMFTELNQALAWLKTFEE
jgi:hypothetical protein